MAQTKILKIGITGGIGSGKTTICRIFETLGIPVYDADTQAKRLMTTDKSLIAAIKKAFGSDSYDTEGHLNRPYLAQLVFQNPLKLNELNALVHPAVLHDGEIWHQQQTGVPYTLKEAALLFESDSYKFLDKIITVYAPVETRIERVILRGGGTIKRTEVEARIAKQLPDEEKVKRSDFVISNDGTQALIPQVLKIHQTLRNILKY